MKLNTEIIVLNFICAVLVKEALCEPTVIAHDVVRNENRRSDFWSTLFGFVKPTESPPPQSLYELKQTALGPCFIMVSTTTTTTPPPMGPLCPLGTLQTESPIANFPDQGQLPLGPNEIFPGFPGESPYADGLQGGNNGPQQGFPGEIPDKTFFQRPNLLPGSPFVPNQLLQNQPTEIFPPPNFPDQSQIPIQNQLQPGPPPGQNGFPLNQPYPVQPGLGPFSNQGYPNSVLPNQLIPGAPPDHLFNNSQPTQEFNVPPSNEMDQVGPAGIFPGTDEIVSPDTMNPEKIRPPSVKKFPGESLLGPDNMPTHGELPFETQSNPNLGGETPWDPNNMPIPGEQTLPSHFNPNLGGFNPNFPGKTPWGTNNMPIPGEQPIGTQFNPNIAGEFPFGPDNMPLPGQQPIGSQFNPNNPGEIPLGPNNIPTFVTQPLGTQFNPNFPGETSFSEDGMPIIPGEQPISSQLNPNLAAESPFGTQSNPNFPVETPWNPNNVPIPGETQLNPNIAGESSLGIQVNPNFQGENPLAPGNSIPGETQLSPQNPYFPTDEEIAQHNQEVVEQNKQQQQVDQAFQQQQQIDQAFQQQQQIDQAFQQQQQIDQAIQQQQQIDQAFQNQQQFDETIQQQQQFDQAIQQQQLQDALNEQFQAGESNPLFPGSMPESGFPDNLMPGETQGLTPEEPNFYRPGDDRDSPGSGPIISPPMIPGNIPIGSLEQDHAVPTELRPVHVLPPQNSEVIPGSPDFVNPSNIFPEWNGGVPDFGPGTSAFQPGGNIPGTPVGINPFNPSQQGEIPQVGLGQTSNAKFPSGEIPINGIFPEQNPFNPIPGTQMPLDQIPTGQFTQGELLPGQVPNGLLPGQLLPDSTDLISPQGQLLPGQIPIDQLSTGQSPFGQLPTSINPVDQFPQGQIPINQFPNGFPSEPGMISFVPVQPGGGLLPESSGFPSQITDTFPSSNLPIDQVPSGTQEDPFFNPSSQIPEIAGEFPSMQERPFTAQIPTFPGSDRIPSIPTPEFPDQSVIESIPYPENIPQFPGQGGLPDLPGQSGLPQFPGLPESPFPIPTIPGQSALSNEVMPGEIPQSLPLDCALCQPGRPNAGVSSNLPTVPEMTPGVETCAGLPPGPFVPPGYIPVDNELQQQRNMDQCGLTPITPVDCTMIQVFEQLRLRVIYNLILDAGLEKLFTQTSNYTFFAPVDNAFDILPNWFMQSLRTDKQLLVAFITNHIIKINIPLESLGSEFLVMNFRGSRVRINVYNQDTDYRVYTVDGSRVLSGDIKTTTGLLHIVDKVIMPIPKRNLAGYLGEVKDFSNFLQAVTKAGMLPDLDETIPYTVFIPVNSLSLKNFVNMDDTMALRNFVNFHIVNGTYFSAGLVHGQYLVTNYFKEIKLSVCSDGYTKFANNINGQIRIIKSDIPVLNGVAHIIEKRITDDNNFFVYEELSEFASEFAAFRRKMVLSKEELRRGF